MNFNKVRGVDFLCFFALFLFRRPLRQRKLRNYIIHILYGLRGIEETRETSRMVLEFIYKYIKTHYDEN